MIESFAWISNPLDCVRAWAGVSLACVSAAMAQDPELVQPLPDGYELVWAQEFETDGRPDPETWTFEQGLVRNQEAQWYQEDNARIEEGRLVIEARRERVINPDYDPEATTWKRTRTHANYTSSSLSTRGNHEWLYGIFEMRARIDTRSGLWPAWWTLGSARPWPGCGEIDIMEYYKGDILANVCWAKKGGRWAQNWDTTKHPVSELGENWSDGFHVWRMLWTEDVIEITLDGTLLNRVDINTTMNPDGSNPFREPHYMIVNLALGGTNGGPVQSESVPARYEIDYLRVYQKIEPSVEGQE